MPLSHDMDCMGFTWHFHSYVIRPLARVKFCLHPIGRKMRQFASENPWILGDFGWIPDFHHQLTSCHALATRPLVPSHCLPILLGDHPSMAAGGLEEIGRDRGFNML